MQRIHLREVNGKKAEEPETVWQFWRDRMMAWYKRGSGGRVDLVDVQEGESKKGLASQE